LRSFSLILSIDLGARKSLIIYLQSWSESMALAPSIRWISPGSPKTYFFEFIQNQKENFGFGKTLFWKLIPYVEVTLVSKFHPIWCPIAHESRLGRQRRILGKHRVSDTPNRTKSDSTGQSQKFVDIV
jgi:hypothetical protein